MKTSTACRSALLIITTLALTASASASFIGPWPTTNAFMWQTNPFSPVCGKAEILKADTSPPGPAQGVIQMSGIGTGSKNAWWLPYSILDANYGERLCMARFVFDSPVTNVHARVFDPSKTGANGWAIILKDSSGRILDFGLRTYFANKQVRAYQYDGTNWTPRYFYDRNRTGNDYYSMNFTNNSDGTITWSLEAMIWDSAGGVFNYSTNTENTTVTYGNITEVYLNAMTKDTTTANYKWTEFSTSPAVISPPPLQIAPTNTAEVALWWPSLWTTNFVVQTNGDLSSTSWGAVTNTPTDDGTNISMTLPLEPGNQFFRLKQ